MTENKYKNRKNAIIASCSYNQLDMLKPCLSSKCAKCKGDCCQNYPCTMSPREFIDINNIDYMKSVLDTGVLAIAPASADCTFFIIRPRGERDLDTIATGFAFNPNSCILQGKKGCVLNALYRPTEGLLLIPTINKYTGKEECKPYYSDFKIIEDWQKHQAVLKELRKMYKDIEIEKPIANEETAKRYILALRGECQKETK